MKEIGQRLKEARENKGLTLRDVSEETKIRLLYLQALEEGNFERIPGKVYVKGFLKAYAKIVGLDPEEILHEYQEYLNQTEPEEDLDFSELPVTPTGSSKSVGKIIILILIVLLLALSIFYIKDIVLTIKNETIPQLLKTEEPELINSDFQESTNITNNESLSENDSQKNGQPSFIESEVRNVSVVNDSESVNVNEDFETDRIENKSDELMASEDSTTNSPSEHKSQLENQNGENIDENENLVDTDGQRVVASLDGVLADKQDKNDSEEEDFVHDEKNFGNTGSTSGDENVGLNNKEKPVEAKEKLQLQVIAIKNSWVRVAADGKVLYQGLMQKGETKLFEGYKINLRINNAEGIQVNYKGIILGPFGGKDEFVEKVFGE